MTLWENRDVARLTQTMREIHARVAPDIEWIPQMGLSRHCPIQYLMEWSAPFLELDFYQSVDLYADEFAQPIGVFKPVYRAAKAKGLRLRAHAGEWGTADDVWQAVEELELDEVQHFARQAIADAGDRPGRAALHKAVVDGSVDAHHQRQRQPAGHRAGADGDRGRAQAGERDGHDEGAQAPAHDGPGRYGHSLRGVPPGEAATGSSGRYPRRSGPGASRPASGLARQIPAHGCATVSSGCRLPFRTDFQW